MCRDNILIEVYDGKRCCKKRLFNVLYAPKFSLNLIYVGYAMDENKKLVLESNIEDCHLKLNDIIVAVREQTGRF